MTLKYRNSGTENSSFIASLRLARSQGSLPCPVRYENRADSLRSLIRRFLHNPVIRPGRGRKVTRSTAIDFSHQTMLSTFHSINLQENRCRDVHISGPTV